jgi:tetratricopeptide (TPR) repeat protein
MPAKSAYKGGISYSIPIEYKNLSESELRVKAETYFNQTSDIKNGIISPETTNALNLYSVLAHINPTEVIYPVKLGILYDKINRDRYAKGSFSRAIGIDSSRYEPYFYFGEFYYKREMYRKALMYYKKAAECINSSDEVNIRLEELNRKLGVGS